MRSEGVISSLISHGYVSRADANRAIDGAKAASASISDAITGLGIMSPTDFADAVCAVTAYRRFDAANDTRRVRGNLLNAAFSATYSVVELEAGEPEPSGPRLGLSDPLCDATLEALEFAFDRRASYVICTSEELEHLLSTTSESPPDASDPALPSSLLLSDVDRLRELAGDAPVVTYLDAVLDHAARTGASDIHFEPDDAHLRVRIRTDGALVVYPSPPDRDALAVVSRLKILAGLDIAERRVPQDGRMQFVVSGSEIDCRVATGPTTSGESVVLRLLDKRSLSSDFSGLGFDERAVGKLHDALGVANGIVLVTGPTGSGKSTTLYAALSHLNDTHRKILTVEDPVEYSISGINQVQIDVKSGRDFPRVLRSFLRQDPDVMMVGEIRDSETAAISMQAALTGHLVLSTLHTNNAVEAVVRLRDLGVPDYLTAATVRLVVGQRLVRRVCTACQGSGDRKDAFPTDSLEHISTERNPCGTCAGSGFHGRTAIFEILEVTRDVREAISSGASSAELENLLDGSGFETLATRGQRLVERGETTRDEVFRVTRRDDD